jgi:tRNA(Ile2) C34 agmatinyltransferase TiaS
MCRCIAVPCRVCGVSLRTSYQAGVQSIRCPCCGTRASLEGKEEVWPHSSTGIYGPAVATLALAGVIGQ